MKTYKSEEFNRLAEQHVSWLVNLILKLDCSNNGNDLSLDDIQTLMVEEFIHGGKHMEEILEKSAIT